MISKGDSIKIMFTIIKNTMSIIQEIEDRIKNAEKIISDARELKMKHGTNSSYCKGGCRCEECLKAHNEYSKKWYQKNKMILNRIRRRRYREQRGNVRNYYRAPNPNGNFS